MTTEIERAHTIVREVMPKTHPEFACMLVASALAGMKGLTFRRIRVGALWWPERFSNDPYLSMRGGWGCEGYSEADKRLFLADDTVDPDDGSFAGHTWLEPVPGDVVDLMHDNEGSAHEIYDAEFKLVARYIHRPKLERAVKARWWTEMTAALKAGRKAAGL